jgi:rRNA maturation endonuclease Nob1
MVTNLCPHCGGHKLVRIRRTYGDASSQQFFHETLMFPYYPGSNEIILQIYCENCETLFKVEENR